MIDLGLPGYSRPTSRATSRATSRITSRANSRSPSPDGNMSVISCATNFTDQSCASDFTLQFNTQRGRERPAILNMNYQTRDSAKINETTSQRKANNQNKVVMSSINVLTPNEKYKHLLREQKKQKDLLRQRKLTATKIVPPEIKKPIEFSDNPKNTNYTMERMPVVDNAKKGYIFQPKLPEGYLQYKRNVTNPTKPKTKKTKTEPTVLKTVYSNKPDEIKNKNTVWLDKKKRDFVPSWERK